MNPVNFLRGASILAVIHSILHTIGGVFGKPDLAIQEQVLKTMRDNAFPIMGMTRTYADFYRGFGLAISVFLLAEGIVFWQLATMAKTDSARLKPVLITFTLLYLGMATVSAVYFFPPPVVTEVLLAACLVGAIATAKAPQALR